MTNTFWRQKQLYCASFLLYFGITIVVLSFYVSPFVLTAKAAIADRVGTPGFQLNPTSEVKRGRLRRQNGSSAHGVYVQGPSISTHMKGTFDSSSSIIYLIPFTQDSTGVQLEVTVNSPAVLFLRFGGIATYSDSTYDAKYAINSTSSSGKRYFLHLNPEDIRAVMQSSSHAAVNSGVLTAVLWGGLISAGDPAGDMPSIEYSMGATVFTRPRPLERGQEAFALVTPQKKCVQLQKTTSPQQQLIKVARAAEVLQAWVAKGGGGGGGPDVVPAAFPVASEEVRAAAAARLCAAPPGHAGAARRSCGGVDPAAAAAAAAGAAAGAAGPPSSLAVHRPGTGVWNLTVVLGPNLVASGDKELFMCFRTHECRHDLILSSEIPSWKTVPLPNQWEESSILSNNKSLADVMLTQHLVCLQRVKKFSTSLGNGNCKTSTVLAGFDFAADALDEKLITKSQHFIVNLAGTEIGAHMLIILRGSGLPGGRYGTTLSTMKKLNIRLRYGAPVSSMSPEMDAYFLDPVVNGTLNVSASKSRGTEFYWLLPHPVVPIGLSGKQAQLYLRVETTEHIEASLLSKLQLSLLVRFRDCIPEICPPHRGTCSPLQMATGYLSTTCTCRYGYAGDRCEINVLSPGGRLTQAVFLIISNAPGFMAAYLSWRHRFFGLMSALIFSTIASALYHSCDIGYACFYSRLPTAKMVDQFGVLILIVLLVLQQSPLPRYIEPVFIIAWLGPITTTLIRESGGLDSNIDSGALTFIVAGAAAFLVLTWAAALLRAGALAGALAPLPPPRGTAAPGGRGGGARLRRLGRLIHAILFQYKVFHWLKIGSAWIVILFGFLTYLFQESSTYYIWHSIWHIASYTSAALFVLGKPQTYNEGKIAHFLSSGQANREKTGDEGEVKDSDDDDIQLLSSSSSVYHLQQRKKKRYPGSVGRHKFPTMI